MNERKRAHTVAEYQALDSRIFTATKPPEFNVRSTDVVITPYAKSGTTWLQQIFHCLRTRGDMDFDDISRVVPWLEVSHYVGIDLNIDQRAEPRGFKSHAPADQVPHGCRYINSIRNPKDVAWSLYQFMLGWFIEPGTVSADEFVRGDFLMKGEYFKHLVSWWPRRSDENVLFLAYEQMRQDLEGTIHKVARFSGIAMDSELLALTMEHASLPFMQAHIDRFDDRLLRDLTELEVLPHGSDSAKVRTGQVGEHQEGLGADVIEEIEREWAEQITPVLGYANYEALLEALV